MLNQSKYSPEKTVNTHNGQRPFTKADNAMLASSLSPLAKLLYLELLRLSGIARAQSGWRVHPSQRYLSGYLGCSEKTLRGATAELKSAQLIKVTYKGNSFKRKANEYFLTRPDLWELPKRKILEIRPSQDTNTENDNDDAILRTVSAIELYLSENHITSRYVADLVQDFRSYFTEDHIRAAITQFCELGSAQIDIAANGEESLVLLKTPPDPDKPVGEIIPNSSTAAPISNGGPANE